jgi:hypothetical protein
MNIALPIDALIALNKTKSKEFEQELTRLVKFYDQKIKNLNASEGELLKRWYKLCNETYAVRRRIISDYLVGSTINERTLDDFQYRRQMGSRIYPLLLDFISISEFIFQLLLLNSPALSLKLDERIKPIKESLKKHWSETNKDIRSSVLSSVGFKRQSVSFIRDTLVEMGVVKQHDSDFLKSVWELRNQIHANFIAQKNINFTFMPDSGGVMLSYSVKKGQPLYTPDWSLMKITERISRIMQETIAGVKDIPANNITDL